MPERILGLDIGGGSVKAVLLSRGFRGGYRVIGFRGIDIAAAGGSEGGPGTALCGRGFPRRGLRDGAPRRETFLQEHPASIP